MKVSFVFNTKVDFDPELRVSMDMESVPVAGEYIQFDDGDDLLEGQVQFVRHVFNLNGPNEIQVIVDIRNEDSPEILLNQFKP